MTVKRLVGRVNGISKEKIVIKLNDSLYRMRIRPKHADTLIIVNRGINFAIV